MARSGVAGWAALSPGLGETITPEVEALVSADFDEELPLEAATAATPGGDMRARNPEFTSAGGGATAVLPSELPACFGRLCNSTGGGATIGFPFNALDCARVRTEFNSTGGGTTT